MNNYELHAAREFLGAGWVDAKGNWANEMQQLMCQQILELLNLFCTHGHSGTSAPYAVNLFKALAMFEPIVPLQGTIKQD